MRYIADLHLHSLFSRATSKNSHLRGFAAWAAAKGLDVAATGDFTHPGWFAHLQEELEEAEPGLFRLKPAPDYDYAALLPAGMKPARRPEDLRFILGTEISCIYKRGGRTRKVHNLIYAPDMQTVRRINTRLADLGNIQADGRPILGLDSRDLLEIVLNCSPDCFFIPAHIWTPWFSLFGSKSGFDRIEDCFADLTHHIFALETGLSSDPAMNRLLSALDRFTLVSNSDCHSPQKLGREANLFDTDLSFFALREALKAPRDADGRQRMLATLEFFPEEGKYHADGHRKCGVRLDPEKTRELGGRCPVCGGPLTVGVLNRVLELADRREPVFPEGAPGLRRLVPLAELVAELLDVGPTSVKVAAACSRLVSAFGSEFNLLMDAPLEDMKDYGLLAEAVSRARNDQVIREPGYDGEFGTIRLFADGELDRLRGQNALFPQAGATVRRTGGRAKRASQATPTKTSSSGDTPPADPAEAPAPRLNEAQRAAVTSCAGVIVVQAGPGTGKTHTLAGRAARLLEDGETICTLITFTNKAADELKRRLRPEALERPDRCRVATFHGFCLELLRLFTPDLAVVGPEERETLLTGLCPEATARARLTEELARFLAEDAGQDDAAATPSVRQYLAALSARHLIDLDDICRQALRLLRQGAADDPGAQRLRRLTGTLFVDEFQDVNAVQYALVAELAKTNPVFCIGDPDQAIYGFRGASPRWFHQLLADFPAELHTLNRNYRSGRAIITAAASLIRRNPHPLPALAMEATTRQKGRIHVQSCKSPLDEARFIADQIEAQCGGFSHRGVDRLDQTAAAGATPDGVGLADIAVLFRSLRLAQPLRDILSQRGIPFRQADLRAWYMEGPCRLLYAWLLLLAGRDRVEQLLFALGQEPGMGAARLGTAQHCLRTLEAGENAPLSALLDALSQTGQADFAGFADFARQLVESAELDWPRPLERLTALLSTRHGFDAADPQLTQLAQYGAAFESLSACATHLERYSDSVLYDPQAQAVTLATLHASKGLEFEVVFVAGCEQGVLPILPRGNPEPEVLAEHLAEERRLFYVGMTRARQTLYCTWSALRSGFPLGNEGGAERQPSTFLFEFPPELVSPAPRLKPAAKKKRARARQLSLFSGK